VVSFVGDEAWDALLGVKTADAGTAVAAAGGGQRCPLLPPLFYSCDCGGQFYSNEKQFSFLLLICNQMLSQVFLCRY
jgi:hypothetical protein